MTNTLCLAVCISSAIACAPGSIDPPVVGAPAVQQTSPPPTATAAVSTLSTPSPTSVPSVTTPSLTPATPGCRWSSKSGSQAIFDPRPSSLCFVKSQNGSGIDISIATQDRVHPSDWACMNGPAPSFVASVEHDGVFTHRMGSSEILCTHGHGFTEPVRPGPPHHELSG